MKKLIAPIVILVAFLGAASLAYLASQHYDVYTKQQQASAASAQAKKEAEGKQRLTVLQTENVNVKKGNEFLRVNCLKGATAFSKLPLATQRLIGKIDCGE